MGLEIFVIFDSCLALLETIHLLMNRMQGTKKNKHTDIKTEIKPNLKKQSGNQLVHKPAR